MLTAVLVPPIHRLGLEGVRPVFTQQLERPALCMRFKMRFVRSGAWRGFPNSKVHMVPLAFEPKPCSGPPTLHVWIIRCAPLSPTTASHREDREVKHRDSACMVMHICLHSGVLWAEVRKLGLALGLFLSSDYRFLRTQQDQPLIWTQREVACALLMHPHQPARLLYRR